MMFALSARTDKVRLDAFARALFASVPEIHAKLIISFRIVGLLANHHFRLIERHHFVMRCFPRPLGGPRQTNIRGGES